ncbi:Chaperone of endosialidase [anaerobic digester metagenome]
MPNAAGSNQVRIGSTTVTYAGVQVAWTITSDRRWKENVQTSELGLSFINALHPVSYVRKNDENHKTEFGFIAQELEETLQEFKVTNSGILTSDDDGMLSLRYNDLIAPMVKAIQELKAENDLLKADNQSLKAELETINTQNNQTETRLAKLEQFFRVTAENK